MRELLRRSPRFFLASVAAGIGLRLLFLLRFPAITADSLSYADIAKNWLQHGLYAITGISGPVLTYTRLPGYPAFLAVIFALFGLDNYRAVLVVQWFVDLATCLLIADIARRMFSDRAAKAAFLMAALCPFLANYAAAALTETLEIFFTSLALDLALVALRHRTYVPWAACGLSISACILLRPDGGLLLVAVGVYLGWILLTSHWEHESLFPVLGSGIVVAVFALAPLTPWALRNWRAFHKFQPLAPRYATEANEFVPLGFNHWVRTWMVDYTSVEEIYWQVPGLPIDPNQLPARAFDSPQQRQETFQVIADYNHQLRITPALDRQFEEFARQRQIASPFRYFIWLPTLRIAGMWLRPRTELLPSDVRWWEFNEEFRWSALSIILMLLSLFYVAAALVGWWHVRFTKHLALLLTFVVLRSLFLGTLENPEPRYVLECFPVLLVLGSALFGL